MCDQQDGGQSMHCAWPKYVHVHDMRIMHDMCMCMIAAGLNVKTWLHAMSLFDALTLSPFPTARLNNPILLQETFPGKCEKGNVSSPPEETRLNCCLDVLTKFLLPSQILPLILLPG